MICTLLNQSWQWKACGPFRYKSYDYRKWDGSWEVNINFSHIDVRIGNRQLALWWKQKSLLCWVSNKKRATPAFID